MRVHDEALAMSGAATKIYDVSWRGVAEGIVFGATLLATAAMLVWLLVRSRYGIDFTDESFYLVWISNPWIYPVSATQFGFLYHPLYQLLDGDIVLLRQCNILMLFGLAWWCCALLLKNVAVISSAEERWGEWAVYSLAGTLATCIFVLLDPWFVTPSYNTLTLKALLLSGIGLMLADKQVSGASLTGWIFIGFAGWLAFMAKPTSAALLSVVIPAYVLVAGKTNVYLASLSVITALLLLICSAWMIDGSIMIFGERVRSSVDMAALLGAGHTIDNFFRIDQFAFEPREKQYVLLWIALIASSTCLVASDRRYLVVVGLLLPFLFAGLSLAVAVGGVQPEIGFQALVIWAVPIGSCVAAVALKAIQGVSGLSRGQLATGLCFLLLPYVYAFGTGINYWTAGARAGFFWILAGLTFLIPAMSRRWGLRILLPTAAAAQTLTVLLVGSSMEHPTRQPEPLRMNDRVVAMGSSRSELILAKGFAEYLEEAKRLATLAGFEIGMPMIDMSGQSPGLLFAIGAKSIGQAWMIGGYKGSDDLAKATLNLVPCRDLSAAWLLVEPNGPRSLSLSILREMGFDFDRGYETVGELVTPAMAGGYEQARRQLILKPKQNRSVSPLSCERREASLL